MIGIVFIMKPRYDANITPNFFENAEFSGAGTIFRGEGVQKI